MGSSATIYLTGPIFLLAILFLLWGFKNPLVILFGVIALRVVLDSVTGLRAYSVGGLSVLQVYSLIVTAAFFLIILLKGHFRQVSARQLTNLILYSLIAVSFISAIVNLSFSGFLVVSTKWLFFIGAIGFISYCVEIEGVGKAARVIFWALLYPLANQLVMLLLGMPPKCSAGICSYVGTYDHESELGGLLFFGVIVTLILVLSARSFASKLFYVIVLILFHIGLMLNYYRTLIFVLIIFWAIFIVLRFGSLTPTMRVLLIVGSLLGAAISAYVGLSIVSELTSDLIIFLSDPFDYISFTRDGGGEVAKSLFSGRIYLVNLYIYSYTVAPLEVLIVGYGPSYGADAFGVYAHNQFLGVLTESGFIGLLLFLTWMLLVGRQIWSQVNLDNPTAAVLFSAYISIFVWSLGTMPFENIRALLLIAAVISFARYSSLKSKT